MISNCAVYLPITKVDFKSILPGGNSDGGLFREAARYDYKTEDGPVRLKIAYARDMADHLRGMKGYVEQLPNTDLAKRQAIALIHQVQMIVGVDLPGPVSPQSDTFASLTALAEAAGGFIFVSDSILTHDGFLVGPMSHPTPVMEPAATVQIEPGQEAASEPEISEALKAMRKRNLRALSEHGFRCPPNLPIDTGTTIRPAGEIAARFAALGALYNYVAAPDSFIAPNTLEGLIARDRLRDALTPEELAILVMPREAARAEHADSIGWRLENMWPLAWALGFEPEPPFQSGQIPGDVFQSMVNLLPGKDTSLADVIANRPLRLEAKIREMEDRFYCAHNAVRSAQLGEPTVPATFHPVVDGGAIHERRHALTWMVSPDVAWDDTDLST